VNPMSDVAFKWFVTALTGGLAGTWVFYDGFNLWKTLRLDRRDPVVRDRQFGYVCGIAIGVIGVLGCFKFHGVL
jgi:hypothetical protein